jgi:hypothetical protein
MNFVLFCFLSGAAFYGCSGAGDTSDSSVAQNQNEITDSGDTDDVDGDTDDSGDTDDADDDTDDSDDTGDGDATPTCSDNIQNQDETGIDCGGSCDPCYTGTTYYVSNDGDDSNDGLSPGADGAWRTIAKVNASTFSPGDAVLFQRGGEWRDQLIITWSGTEDAYITFGAYGEGDLPRILASELAGDWTAVTGESHIWQSATPLDTPLNGHPASIFFGHSDDSITWGNVWSITAVNDCGTDFENLGVEYDWCWEDDTVYVYAPEDPDERYTFVEVPQRRGAITMQNHNAQEYIAIDGLELMFGTMYGYNDGWPMDYEVRGLTIKNCHVAYIGIRGGNSAMGLTIWHSDMLVQNNDIHDSGRRNISYNVYTDNGKNTPNQVFENVIFEGNTLHNGYHTTGFDISHGHTMFDTFRNFTFRNNFIWDDPDDDPTDSPNDFTSMGLYLHPGAGQFTDFKVYNNIFKHLKQKSLAITGCDNLSIYNNTIYGTNPNIGSYRPMVSLSGDYTNLEFYNNIVYGTVDHDDFLSRCVYLGSGDVEVTTLNNNLYFQDDAEQVIHYSSYSSYRMNDSEWAAYQTDTGWDTDSPAPSNPLFVDAENMDFYLEAGSPAIDAGLEVADRATDYFGNPIVGDPDIGAVENID